MEEHVSPRVVAQRIRNHVIGALELSSSLEAQVEYQLNVPSVYIPNEILAWWSDWIDVDPRIEQPTPQVSDIYSSDEIMAMGAFHDTWMTTCAATDDWVELTIVQSRPEWRALQDAALAALKVFELRGRMPEDREVDWSA